MKMFKSIKNKDKMLKGKILPISDSTVSHLRSASLFSNNKTAQFRLKVIEFANEYGVKAATDAFNVSRATIYRWKKMLKDNNGKLISLMPKSRKPKRLRKMIVDPEIISFIRRTREEHPGIGKEKIKPLLDKYCKERNIKTMSISTIGRIIKRYDMRYTPKEIGYHNPNSKWAKNKRLKRNKVHTNRIKHSPVSSSLGYIEIDTIVKFINGIKRYIYNAVDINTRFSFSYAYKSKNSKNALLFFKKLEKVYPEDKGMATVQTDNGSEYLGVFDKYLKDKHIKHLFAYPRCPRVNGYIERANRTLQEEFLNYHLFLLSDDIKAFNSQLIDYLIWYNTERPHHSLDNLSPIDFMIKYYLKSQMYRTYTLS
jgi:transposase InsO family protein